LGAISLAIVAVDGLPGGKGIRGNLKATVVAIHDFQGQNLCKTKPKLSPQTIGRECSQNSIIYSVCGYYSESANLNCGVRPRLRACTGVTWSSEHLVCDRRSVAGKSDAQRESAGA
jgi:hypothetical protein